jgi:TolB protein
MGLLNRLTSTFLLAGALGLSAYGCENSTGPDSKPFSELYASPPSGVAPLETRVWGWCEDSDDDIASYRVIRADGSVLTTANPTDITLTLYGPDSFESFCVDKKGNETSSGPVAVEVTQPQPQLVGTIAFYRSMNNPGNIYLINEDGSGLEQLTYGPQDMAPVFSPDGRQVAFHTNECGNTCISIMDADGSNQVILNPDFGYDVSNPAWSPDGEKIALSFREGNLAGIAVMNSDGTDFKRIIEKSVGSRIPGEPSWSPDGKQIAYHDYEDENFEIFVMDADGTNQINITNNPAYDITPTWSLDGRIAFVSDPDPNDEFYEAEIYTIDPDGGNKTQLTHNSAEDLEPSWVFDGRIAFMRRESSATTQDIWVMDGDGTNQRKIFESPLSHDAHPTWKPKTEN